MSKNGSKAASDSAPSAGKQQSDKPKKETTKDGKQSERKPGVKKEVKPASDRQPGVDNPVNADEKIIPSNENAEKSTEGGEPVTSMQSVSDNPAKTDENIIPSNENSEKSPEDGKPVIGTQSGSENPDKADEKIIPSNENSEQSHEGGEPGADTESHKKLSIVIPYLKSAAQGQELLYAVRSIAKNFVGEAQLVVIGDKEDWFSEDVISISHACIGSNPQADVIDKIKHILIDENIGDVFVLSNDDIYMITPTTLEDILQLKTCGSLQFNPNERSLYNTNRLKTIEALNEKGLPIRNFDTHLPFCFEKEKMAEVFEAFPELGDGLLLASVYFNMHTPEEEPTSHIDGLSGPWLLRIVSQLETNEKKEQFRKLIQDKHFLNNSESGYSKLLMDWIARQFPEKCRFEK